MTDFKGWDPKKLDTVMRNGYYWAGIIIEHGDIYEIQYVRTGGGITIDEYWFLIGRNNKVVAWRYTDFEQVD